MTTNTTPTDATETRQERYREVLATLESGIADIVTGDGFARYLHCMARFHAYSLNNIALIYAQRPDATRVAGYRAWRALGRQVRRGTGDPHHRAASHPRGAGDGRAGSGHGIRLRRGHGVRRGADYRRTTRRAAPSRRATWGRNPRGVGARRTDRLVAGAGCNARTTGHGTGERLLPAAHTGDRGASRPRGAAGVENADARGGALRRRPHGRGRARGCGNGGGERSIRDAGTFRAGHKRLQLPVCGGVGTGRDRVPAQPRGDRADGAYTHPRRSGRGGRQSGVAEARAA